MTKYTRNDDGSYGPTAIVREGEAGKYYRPKQDHGRKAKKSKHKTRWSIEEGYEFHVFKTSMEPFFFCEENDCLFSLVDDGKQKLGENGELVAKFPNVSNEDDEWHGYPVNCKENQNTPSDDLLDLSLIHISEPTRPY